MIESPSLEEFAVSPVIFRDSLRTLTGLASAVLAAKRREMAVNFIVRELIERLYLGWI